MVLCCVPRKVAFRMFFVSSIVLGLSQIGALEAEAKTRGATELYFQTVSEKRVPGSTRVASTEVGPGAKTYEFNIGSQKLSGAIAELGYMTGLSIAYTSSLPNEVKFDGLTGTYTAHDALKILLKGTELSVKISKQKTVVLAQASTGSTLDAITVVGDDDGDSNGEAAEDAPFQTPGSSDYISSEEFNRVSPSSTGDVFQSTPGVISAGNRVGSSINPNIRGLQGNNRINTTIDGALQSTSSYRGYIGNRDEVYVDPDMIGGIDISKGPSDGTGVGGIGGSINFRTLEPIDIIQEGKTFGVRLKGGLGTNSIGERVPGTMTGEDRPSFFNGSTYSGSVAAAAKMENFEFVGAYSKRKSGNYFVGTNLPDEGIEFSTMPGMNGGGGNAVVMPGEEAFNTSEETESFLAKGKVLWGDGQSLQLGYVYYDSDYGEIDELNFGPNIPHAQRELSHTRVKTYTSKYRFKPSDNPYVNLRANLWLSDVDVDSQGFLKGAHEVRTTGGDVGNISLFTTPLGNLSLDTGLEFVRQHEVAEQTLTGNIWSSNGPSGVRAMTSAFSKASMEFTDWLTVTAGARYDHYNSEGEGYLTRYPDQSGNRVSPNASVTITPLEGIQFYGQYVEGYRPPSLRESHWHFQTLLQVNPDLQPELSANKEIGLNILKNDIVIAGDKLRFKASYFDNQYDDYIVRLRLGSDPYRWANIDHATYQGYELSGGYDAGLFFFEGAYTKYKKLEYCITANDCIRDGISNDWAANYLPPDSAGSLTAGIRLLDQDLTLGVRTHFAAERSGTTSFLGLGGRTVYWPEYQIYDLFGSYEYEDDFVLNFSVANIFDDYYFGALASVGIASPGRTARFGITTNLSSSPPSLQPWPFALSSSNGVSESSWTGFYIGGHWGHGFGDNSEMVTLANGMTAREGEGNYDLKNTIRGLQLGFNYQTPDRFVFGFEGDFTWLGKGFDEERDYVSTEGAGLNLLIGDPFLEAKRESNLDWLSTLRVRAGYALDDNLMVYGTGGVAFLKQTENRTQFMLEKFIGSGNRYWTVPTFVESASPTQIGWTLGGGLEYQIAGGWSLKAEYLYSGFRGKDITLRKARAGVTSDKTETTTTGGEPIHADLADQFACFFNPPIPGDPRSCFTPVVTTTTTTPGTYNDVNGRTISNDIDLHSLRVGLNYRF